MIDVSNVKVPLCTTYPSPFLEVETLSHVSLHGHLFTIIYFFHVYNHDSGKYS